MSRFEMPPAVEEIFEDLCDKLRRMPSDGEKMAEVLSTLPPVSRLLYTALAYVSRQRYNPAKPSDTSMNPLWGKPHPPLQEDEEPSRKVLPINVDQIFCNEHERDFRQLIFRFMRNVCDGIQPLEHAVGFLTYHVLPRTDDQEVHEMFSHFHAALGKTNPPANYNRHFHETILKYGALKDGDGNDLGYLRWLCREINWLRRCLATRERRRSVSPDRYEPKQTQTGPKVPSQVKGDENLRLKDHEFYGKLLGEIDDHPTISTKALKLDYKIHPCHCELHENYVQNVLQMHSWMFISDLTQDAVLNKKALIYTHILCPFVTQYEKDQTLNEEFGEMVRLCVQVIIEYPSGSDLRAFALTHLKSISSAVRLLESKSHYYSFERPLGVAFCKLLGQIMFVESGHDVELMHDLLVDRFSPWVSATVLHHMLTSCGLLKAESKVGFESAFKVFRRIEKGERVEEEVTESRSKRTRRNEALKPEEEMKRVLAKSEDMFGRLGCSYVLHLMLARPEYTELFNVIDMLNCGELKLGSFCDVKGSDAHRAVRNFKPVISEVGYLYHLPLRVQKLKKFLMAKYGVVPEELSMLENWFEDVKFEAVPGRELGVEVSP